MSATAQPLFSGNTAKLYCLRIVEQLLRTGLPRITILDLGCGSGQPVAGLLGRYPDRIHYVGVEPYAAACDRARTLLSGFSVEVRNESAYDVRLDEPVDVVLSFSVLEHVYDRPRYLEAAARNLASRGVFLINYDSGHFMRPTGSVLQRGSDRWKNQWGATLARFGREHHFQRFVREAEFQSAIQGLGFATRDAKFFNSEVKQVFKLVPAESRATVMEQWLAFELQLNGSGIRYDDSLATLFMTRNFVITHTAADVDVEPLLPR